MMDSDAVFPTEAQVQAGIEYGPNGNDYTGTLSGGGGGGDLGIFGSVWK
jgi:hypothetical protein